METTEFDGRTALVTGGARGIGAAVALRLAEGGADVAFTYQHDGAAAEAVAGKISGMGRGALALRADSGDPAAIEDAVDRAAAEWGRLDVLVNNAGTYAVGPIADLGAAAFDRSVAVNVRGPYLAARAASRHMRAGGRIISIGSNVADRTTFPGHTLYALTKTALAGMTKGLARDLGPLGITVNLLHPGPTDTDANPADGPYADTVRGFTALGRYAAADEIAAVVAHLASDAASYVTGAVVHADGGFTV
ncbi:SDR family NAD(P)-dependent oxidoreductase [Actinacidiphila paucisporea]|uniref:3-oxoacyl-[acyl-carrier protein] reductase n=1 Tax=Actinacidiphila paucisporea TaxID=310782 RepID=A0A1M7QTE6_9ACTN|nr:SDR family oxidoreductase [Actinacidiphila paucisporea]SHN35075.1 3-oxoacyl-[acyl-carrier protein] reductase [Actinacidiphila paucisporea]